MGRATVVPLALLAFLLALALFPASVGAGTPPSVTSVIEGIHSGTEGPVLCLLGNKLTKFQVFDLAYPDGSPAGAVTLVVKSKTMLVLELPEEIAVGDYVLTCSGKKWDQSVAVHVTRGGVLPGTITEESFATVVHMFREGRIVPFPAEIFTESWELAKAAADTLGFPADGELEDDPFEGLSD